MKNLSNIITRFAPSPTGLLHIGHLASIIFSYDFASKNNGKMVLRIEDIDFSRCKKEFKKNIISDLIWLKFSFIKTKDQSKRIKKYNSALAFLREKKLIYPCWLTRMEANSITSAPHNKFNHIRDSDQLLSGSEINDRKKRGLSPAWRIRMEKAIKIAGKSNTNLSWFDFSVGEVELNVEKFGDFVIARKDISTSYHLSVTLDDDADNVTHITRGNDLFEYTHIHRLLQIIFNLKQSTWFHHPLISNKNGDKLSKRDKTLSIKSLKNDGLNQENIMELTRKLMRNEGFYKFM